MCNWAKRFLFSPIYIERWFFWWKLIWDAFSPECWSVFRDFSFPFAAKKFRPDDPCLGVTWSLINQNVNLCKRLKKLSEICPTSSTQLLTTKLPITVFFLLKCKKICIFTTESLTALVSNYVLFICLSTQGPIKDLRLVIWRKATLLDDFRHGLALEMGF